MTEIAMLPAFPLLPSSGHFDSDRKAFLHAPLEPLSFLPDAFTTPGHADQAIAAGARLLGISAKYVKIGGKISAIHTAPLNPRGPTPGNITAHETMLAVTGGKFVAALADNVGAARKYQELGQKLKAKERELDALDGTRNPKLYYQLHREIREIKRQRKELLVLSPAKTAMEGMKVAGYGAHLASLNREAVMPTAGKSLMEVGGGLQLGADATRLMIYTYEGAQRINTASEKMQRLQEQLEEAQATSRNDEVIRIAEKMRKLDAKQNRTVGRYGAEMSRQLTKIIGRALYYAARVARNPSVALYGVAGAFSIISGVIGTAAATYSLFRSVKRTDALVNAERTFTAKRLEDSPELQAKMNPKEKELFRFFEDMRLANLKSQKMTNNKAQLFKGVEFAYNITGLTYGLLLAIAATGVAVSATAVMATGIGAAALGGVLLSIALGWLVYKNRHRIKLAAQSASKAAQIKIAQLKLRAADSPEEKSRYRMRIARLEREKAERDRFKPFAGLATQFEGYNYRELEGRISRLPLMHMVDGKMLLSAEGERVFRLFAAHHGFHINDEKNINKLMWKILGKKVRPT